MLWSVMGSVLLTGSLLAAQPAVADPVKGAGCKTKTTVQPFKVAGVTTYKMEFNYRWCWTTGGSSSRIHSIAGSTYASANGTFQVQNDVGPASAARIKIPRSWRSSANSTTVNAFFQSRNCTPGPAGAQVCTGWSWHRLKIQLNYGGGAFVVGSN